MKHIRHISASLLWLLLLTVGSCIDTDSIDSRIDALESKIEGIQKAVVKANSNAAAINKLFSGKILITGYQEQEHGYILSFSDGTSASVTYGDTMPYIVPILGINDEGKWIISIDGGKTFTEIGLTQSPLPNDGATPVIEVDSENHWIVSYDGGKTWEKILGEDGKPMKAGAAGTGESEYSFFKNIIINKDDSTITFVLRDDDRELVVSYRDNFKVDFIGYKEGNTVYLEQELQYAINATGVKDAIIKVPDGWSAIMTDETISITTPATGTEGTYTISIILVSAEGLLKNIDLMFTLKNMKYDQTLVKEYRDFLEQNEDNVLLDFSYAGYAHGETAPADVETLGWKVYDVTDYGAIPNDGKSDREAFIKCLQAATKKGYTLNDYRVTFDPNPSAQAIIYFPEGDFIIHTKEDDHVVEGKTWSRSIVIRSGDIVIKGAGRTKTRLVMSDPMQPTSAELYSSPYMIGFHHNSSAGGKMNVDVTADASKGSHSITVANASSFKTGDFVLLHLKNNSPEVIAEELRPYSAAPHMTDLINEGVIVNDIHKIKSISGNVITFHEPLMHAVKASWNWKLQDFPHYDNIGIEDLTFLGQAKSDFKHHGSWEDDGGYKPMTMQRITNGWVRRVNFTDISEGITIGTCANCSCYDLLFDGNRGHSSVRSSGSSRIFIGATRDITSGPALSGGKFIEEAGHCHGAGVSKTSIGAVLWNNILGKDSCFESHAGQPRATLLDCYTGAFKRGSAGGDQSALPHHLSDLTIWNYNSINSPSGEFKWWENSWSFLPPIIVGLHGEASGMTFPAGSVTTDSSRGQAVEPRSLYEAQLKARLGYVPAWLLNLK